MGSCVGGGGRGSSVAYVLGKRMGDARDKVEGSLEVDGLRRAAIMVLLVEELEPEVGLRCQWYPKSYDTIRGHVTVRPTSVTPPETFNVVTDPCNTFLRSSSI